MGIHSCDSLQHRQKIGRYQEDSSGNESVDPKAPTEKYRDPHEEVMGFRRLDNSLHPTHREVCTRRCREHPWRLPVRPRPLLILPGSCSVRDLGRILVTEIGERRISSVWSFRCVTTGEPLILIELTIHSLITSQGHSP